MCLHEIYPKKLMKMPSLTHSLTSGMGREVIQIGSSMSSITVWKWIPPQPHSLLPCSPAEGAISGGYGAFGRWGPSGRREVTGLKRGDLGRLYQVPGSWLPLPFLVHRDVNSSYHMLPPTTTHWVALLCLPCHWWTDILETRSLVSPTTIHKY